MKCRILHETSRRMRVHMISHRMTLEQADLLEYYLRNLTYITLLSSPSISGEYCMEAPTLDSQYNKRTQQISVVTAVGGLDTPISYVSVAGPGIPP